MISYFSTCDGRPAGLLTQSRSITRTFPAAVAALALAGAASAAAPWRDAPEYMALFAPAAHQGAYRAAVSPAALETVLAEAAADPAALPAPGAWSARAMGAADAFGRGGAYDRAALARLYGGRQPRVARGARRDAGRVTESWTLVSPYPSPDLRRLEPGTLRIVLRIAS